MFFKYFNFLPIYSYLNIYNRSVSYFHNILPLHITEAKKLNHRFGYTPSIPYPDKFFEIIEIIESIILTVILKNLKMIFQKFNF